MIFHSCSLGGDSVKHFLLSKPGRNYVCVLQYFHVEGWSCNWVTEDLWEYSSGRSQWEMVDPEVSVLLHCADWRGLLESQIQVELSERFNRQTDPALEHHIEELWTERISKEPWLFNGAKFRLHSFCLASPKHPSCRESLHVPPLSCEEEEGGLNSRKTAEGLCTSDPLHPQNHLDQRHKSASQAENASCMSALPSSACGCTEEGVTASPSSKTTDSKDSKHLLTLRLGLTSYKDYLGTNWSYQVEELRRRGEMEFGDPRALLAQPLGVGAVLCTDDGQVVLIRRSQRVAEAGGLLDIPGGHPEPKVVCEHFDEVVSEEQINMEMLRPRSEAVVSELFSSIRSEIRDEVNVPLTSLGEPVLMGVALNHTSAGRPSAEFYVSCSLTSDEVRKLYWKGGAEAHESTDIVFLGKNDMLQLDRSRPLWSELCPSAKGAMLLYQTVNPDGDQN